MSKSLSYVGSTNSQGKSLYNSSIGQLPSGALDTVNAFLESIKGNPTTDQFGAAASDGNKVFGVLSADTMTGNITTILQELLIGNGNLLQFIPSDQTKINDTLTYSVLVTTNNYQLSGSTGYTSVNINIPYVFNDADHVPDAQNKEAPDNFLNIQNTKFRVSGPFSYLQSVKTAAKSPSLTLNYFDRVNASKLGSTELDLYKWETGIIAERVEQSGGPIKFSYMGYSQQLDRFVMYRTGKYTGTTPYNYTLKNNTLSSQTGTLTEYNIDRIHYDPLAFPAQDPKDLNTALEVDTIYTNTITGSDHTTTRGLTFNSYDDMIINVTPDGINPPVGNCDLFLNTYGEIHMNQGVGNSNSGAGSITLGSTIKLGHNSTTQIDNYLQSLSYLSVGVTTQNMTTVTEIGGSFTSPGTGIGTDVLIDGTINTSGVDDAHGLYSSPVVIIPANNLTISQAGTANVSNVTLRPVDLTIGNNSAVNQSSTLHITGATSNASQNYAMLVDQGVVKFIGPNNSYMSWDSNALNLFNANININPQPGSTVPYIQIGTRGKETNVYALTSHPDVIGQVELYVDGISTRIPLDDNTAFTIWGTITAIQNDATQGGFCIECVISVINGIKKLKWQNVKPIFVDNDNTGDTIFDLIIDYSGDPTNYVLGDAIIFLANSKNGSTTRWLGNIYVSILSIV